MFNSAVFWGAQNSTQLSRWSLSSAEAKGRISSRDVLATLLLRLLAVFASRAQCCSQSTWCLPVSSGPFPSSCFPAGQPPAHTGAWGLAFPFVQLQEVLANPFLQPVQVSLNGSTILWSTTHFSQSCIISKLADSMLCPSIPVINTDITTLSTNSHNIDRWVIRSFQPISLGN